jgi:hypothetical protein
VLHELCAIIVALFLKTHRLPIHGKTQETIQRKKVADFESFLKKNPENVCLNLPFRRLKKRAQTGFDFYLFSLISHSSRKYCFVSSHAA